MEMEMDGENLMHKILITLRGVVQYNCKPNPSHDCTLQIMVVRYVTLRQQNFPSKLKKSFLIEVKLICTSFISFCLAALSTESMSVVAMPGET